MANQAQPDLFLSLHANSSPAPKAQGAEIYIFGQMADGEESMFLAHQENIAGDESVAHSDAHSESGGPALPGDVQVILRDMAHTINTRVSFDVAKNLKRSWEQNLGRSHVHIRQAPFHVLANVQAPAILVEIGYLSHPAEAAWLKKEETIFAIARALKNGLDAVIDRGLDQRSDRSIDPGS